MDPRFDVSAVHSPDRVDGYAADERLWGGADGHDLLDPGGRECHLVLRGRPHAEEDLPARTVSHWRRRPHAHAADYAGWVKVSVAGCRGRRALVGTAVRLCCALLAVSPI